MKTSFSYRRQLATQKAIALGLLTPVAPISKEIKWQDIPALRKASVDPYECLETLLLKDQGLIPQEGIEALRAVGAGSSPWIQLARLLIQRRADFAAQEGAP